MRRLFDRLMERHWFNRLVLRVNRRAFIRWAVDDTVRRYGDALDRLGDA